jgi:hypothetical protein
VKAVDLGRFDGAPGNSRKKTFSKRRNTMSEETKKTEQTEPEVKPVELSEQDLEQIAGGTGSSQATQKAVQTMIKSIGS